MPTPAFEEIADTLEFLDSWEDRYRYVIDLGKEMPRLAPEYCVPEYKVDGCTSQVWLHPLVTPARFDFEGDSDAMIVRGLVAILHALYAGLTPAEVLDVDAAAALTGLGLADHLSSQRSNGLRAMVKRLREIAAAEVSRKSA